MSGLSVDYRYFGNREDELEKLCAVLTKLHEDGVRASDVVILGLRKFDASVAAEIELSDLSWQVVDGRSDHPGDDRVLYFTIHAFKGLESPVVVLTGISDIVSLEGRSLMYVGMSRAKSHLAIVLNNKATPHVQARVAQKLSEGWK